MYRRRGSPRNFTFSEMSCTFKFRTSLHLPLIAPVTSLPIVQLTIHAVADHTFTISGISVMKGHDALFLRMPKIKDDSGAYVQVISLSAKMKLAIDDVVLPAVEKWLVAQTSAQEVSRG